MTQYAPEEWYGVCACRHGDGFPGRDARRVADLLLAHHWHYASRFAY